MTRNIAAAALLSLVAVAPVVTQQKPVPKATIYNITINADGSAYTGTMALAVTAGRVMGTMTITQPTEINGTPAGTLKTGQMTLDFPYRMVQRACDGRIAMEIKMPAKAGSAAATGTVAITECGRPEGKKLTGTIEMKPKAAAKK
jgi:hypothetical protein